MSKIDLMFESSLEDLCQRLETELGRDFLVDITPEKDSFDVGRPKPGENWYSPNFRNIKFIIVRFRGMIRNTKLATIALVDGQVIYDDQGPVYEEQRKVVRAIKKICK